MSTTGAASAELVSQTVKVAPSVGIAGALFMGMTLADWVMVLTLLYTVLQILYLIHKFSKENALWPRAKSALASFTKKLRKS